MISLRSGVKLDLMKKLSAYLFLILFSFSAPSFADDIRDFEIEGISIGDSLLDYFNEEEIKNFYNYDHLPSDMKFRIAEINKDNYNKMKLYDGMQIYYKPEDKNFIIYAVSGFNFCTIAECKNLYKEIKNDFLKDFSGSETTNKRSDDKSGKSISTIYTIEINDGSILIHLNDMSENVEWTDNVAVEISLSEIDNWIKNNWGLGLN